MSRKPQQQEKTESILKKKDTPARSSLRLSFGKDNESLKLTVDEYEINSDATKGRKTGAKPNKKSISERPAGSATKSAIRAFVQQIFIDYQFDNGKTADEQFVEIQAAANKAVREAFFSRENESSFITAELPPIKGQTIIRFIDYVEEVIKNSYVEKILGGFIKDIINRIDSSSSENVFLGAVIHYAEKQHKNWSKLDNFNLLPDLLKNNLIKEFVNLPIILRAMAQKRCEQDFKENNFTLQQKNSLLDLECEVLKQNNNRRLIDNAPDGTPTQKANAILKVQEASLNYEIELYRYTNNYSDYNEARITKSYVVSMRTGMCHIPRKFPDPMIANDRLLKIRNVIKEEIFGVNKEDLKYCKDSWDFKTLYDALNEVKKAESTVKKIRNSPENPNAELHARLDKIIAELEYRRVLYEEVRGGRPEKSLWPWSIHNKLSETKQMLKYVRALKTGPELPPESELPNSRAAKEGKLGNILKEITSISSALQKTSAPHYFEPEEGNEARLLIQHANRNTESNMENLARIREWLKADRLEALKKEVIAKLFSNQDHQTSHTRLSLFASDKIKKSIINCKTEIELLSLLEKLKSESRSSEYFSQPQVDQCIETVIKTAEDNNPLHVENDGSRLQTSVH